MKKYSLVGMALLAATAVTSAFVPSSAKPAGGDLDGVLIHSDVTEDWTCTADDEGGFCSYTVTGNNLPGISSSATGVGTNTDNSTHVIVGADTDFGTTEPDDDPTPDEQ